MQAPVACDKELFREAKATVGWWLPKQRKVKSWWFNKVREAEKRGSGKNSQPLPKFLIYNQDFQETGIQHREVSTGVPHVCSCRLRESGVCRFRGPSPCRVSMWRFTHVLYDTFPSTNSEWDFVLLIVSEISGKERGPCLKLITWRKLRNTAFCGESQLEMDTLSFSNHFRWK